MSLSVSNQVSFSYIDTGKPSNASYTTIFAFPGLGSTAHIFDKIHALAPAAGVRFVTLNRRGYGSTTAYTEDEISVISQGTEEEKNSFLKDRGHEVAVFVDTFAQKYDLPPISPDGKAGGAILVGWSLGNAISLATIAHADSLPSEVQSRFASLIRGLVIHDPPPTSIGFGMPPKDWSPVLDTSIPEELRLPVFNQWASSYFKHGDLSKRDLGLLSYVVPATFRMPSLFNMSEEESIRNQSIATDAAMDLRFALAFIPQLRVTFRKAVFNPGVRNKLSKMWISYFAGEVGPAWGPATLWLMEDEIEKHQKVQIRTQLVDGFNHFSHWDEPKRTLQVYLSGVA